MKFGLITQIRMEICEALKYLKFKRELAGVWDEIRKGWRAADLENRKHALVSAAEKVDALDLEMSKGRAAGLFDRRIIASQLTEKLEEHTGDSLNQCLEVVGKQLMRQGQILRGDRPLIVRHFILLSFAAAMMLTFMGYSGWLLGRVISNEGLVVVYYDGVDFQKRLTRRYEKRLFIDYEGERPAVGVPRKGFSAKWKGYLVVPDAAEYAFATQSDDGLRLYLDGNLLIDNWRRQEWHESAQHITVELEKGRYPLLIEYFNETDTAVLRVRWAGGPIPKNTVLSAPYLQKR